MDPRAILDKIARESMRLHIIIAERLREYVHKLVLV